MSNSRIGTYPVIFRSVGFQKKKKLKIKNLEKKRGGLEKVFENKF